MNVNTRNFLIGLSVSIAIFISSYFIQGPATAKLYITMGVGVFTAMLVGFILYREY